MKLFTERAEFRLGQGLHALPTASGTASLLIALRAVLDGAPQQNANLVAVPSYTFVATVRAIEWCGLTPLFVDVDMDHWHVCPEALAEALTKYEGNIAATIVCSTFGTPPPVDVTARWESLCDAAGTPLVVDSAPGFGAVDSRGRSLGGQGNVEVFSFHATKPFAIGEGGLVASADAELVARMREIANFGLDTNRVPVARSGLNAKMSEVHASMALAVLDRFDEIIEARRTRADSILEAARASDWEVQAEGEKSVWQFVPVLARNGRHRRHVISRAEDAGIEIRKYHPALHLADPFREAPRASSLETTADLADRSLSLPMANDLTSEEIDRVVGVLE